MFRPPGSAAAGFFVWTDNMITKITELRVLARKHTRTAVATLLGLMTSEKVAPPVRLAASNSLLDRGWGRPAQMLAGEDGNSVGIRITEIINDIVAPQPQDDALMLDDADPA